MIFDPSISGLGYAPDEEPELENDYPTEDEDMDRYYERKEVPILTDKDL